MLFYLEPDCFWFHSQKMLPGSSNGMEGFSILRLLNLDILNLLWILSFSSHRANTQVLLSVLLHIRFISANFMTSKVWLLSRPDSFNTGLYQWREADNQ